ncbi:hypothetical protein AO367_0536 [Moraxella catarrhalis]|nr:hypothetical protein AO380_0072 [Moraxella catarrhalis]OAV31256.1 hypothetical protein AO367_0536 [Moraxella catarrhalis]
MQKRLIDPKLPILLGFATIVSHRNYTKITTKLCQKTPL